MTNEDNERFSAVPESVYDRLRTFRDELDVALKDTDAQRVRIAKLRTDVDALLSAAIDESLKSS